MASESETDDFHSLDSLYGDLEGNTPAVCDRKLFNKISNKPLAVYFFLCTIFSTELELKVRENGERGALLTLVFIPLFDMYVYFFFADANTNLYTASTVLGNLLDRQP